jgi:hypothetical protein
MTKQKRRRLKLHKVPTEDDMVAFLLYSEGNYWRPKKRADCAQMSRPCPLVSCKYNLYLDITASGRVHLNFPDIAPHEMTHSCALDVAELHPDGMTLEHVGDVLHLTRERIRQIEAGAKKKTRGSGDLNDVLPWSTS